MRLSEFRRPFPFIALALILAGCATNPVTGQRHVQFFGTDWEKKTGAGLYEPMRQAEGGDWLLDQELTAYVRQVGERVAAQASRKQELDFEFHVINESVPNAWALPGGKIAINRGLLTELESEAELAAVLGHEIVHADAAHGARQQSRAVLTQAGAIAGMVLIESQVDSQVARQAAVMVPLVGAQLITQKYSREAELEADLYGTRYLSAAGYDPQGAVHLQEAFVRLSEGRDSSWLSGLFATHPPSRERVQRNRETVAQLPGGGETGSERFAQRMAYLRRIKPAYDAYDRAVKLAGDGRYDEARTEVERALGIESREANFHALSGDLKAQAGDRKGAMVAYDAALRLNDGYFYYPLRRGQLAAELGDLGGARRDLRRSLQLMPTALGHYLLGNVERDAGQAQTALEHYRQAAGSDSETGRRAQREMVLLESTSQPGRYVATGPYRDNYNKLYCVLRNQASIPLTGIALTMRWVDDSGRAQVLDHAEDRVLEPGKQVWIGTPWSLATGADPRTRLSCEVRQVKPAS